MFKINIDTGSKHITIYCKSYEFEGNNIIMNNILESKRILDLKEFKLDGFDSFIRNNLNDITLHIPTSAQRTLNRLAMLECDIIETTLAEINSDVLDRINYNFTTLKYRLKEDICCIIQRLKNVKAVELAIKKVKCNLWYKLHVFRKSQINYVTSKLLVGSLSLKAKKKINIFNIKTSRKNVKLVHKLHGDIIKTLDKLHIDNN
jgi:hypothetical protein